MWACGRGQIDTDARDHYTFCVVYDSREMQLGETTSKIYNKPRLNLFARQKNYSDTSTRHTVEDELLSSLERSAAGVEDWRRTYRTAWQIIGELLVRLNCAAHATFTTRRLVALTRSRLRTKAAATTAEVGSRLMRRRRSNAKLVVSSSDSYDGPHRYNTVL